jgi:Methyltransferase domain
LDECRNCGSTKTRDLGFIGEVAPFFLKRVLSLEYGLAPSAHPVKLFLRRINLLSKAFQKIYGKSVLIDLVICESCLFIQTRSPFPEEALGKLYTDYRSKTYNDERIHYEPEYAAIASQVGSSAQEIQVRTTGLTEWLRDKIAPERDFSMLDYGGADGKFLPNLQGEKYVFDISEIAPAEGIERVKDKSALRSYSYIQIAHVLEHVSHPLDLAKEAASYLKPGGYLYIEVPQDLSDDLVARLANGDRTTRLDIHEHINKYCVKSVSELLRATRLTVASTQSEVLDFGWSRGTILRGLGRKQ